ncbi:MAG: phage holin family protein [Burkholderiaceae bacterium]|nr:phage holin family protein [Sulfuritalea sp.]MCF8174001.1 phage holin family protein [Burkholderiaceae bacterium]MCF8183444.1 phage holin family protein [Polynucleobacter sp.]
MRLLAVWLINALALLALPYLLPSIHVAGFATALAVAVVLGLINAVIRPILVLLTLPVTLMTLGLFIFVINGAMFLLAARLLDGFVVESFLAGVVGSALYSVISWSLTRLLLNSPPGSEPGLRTIRPKDLE